VREAVRMLLNAISLPFEREDARVAAQLRASLNSRSMPIGAYDPLLAACALRRAPGSGALRSALDLPD
jgi:tRNA(fMet)-specific endonuclease VapC